VISSARLALLALALGCSQPTPEDAAAARDGTEDRAEALPDSVADLVQARIPRAVAGDSGWSYSQQVAADLDGDDRDETVVVLCDVTLDASGRPLWEDGHRWQVYVKEQDGTTTRLYARFIPNGALTAEIVTPASGSTLGLVLLERSASRIGVYEFRYRGANDFQVYRRLERDIDATHRFTGSPRP
jgi:hypothetical protein